MCVLCLIVRVCVFTANFFAIFLLDIVTERIILRFASLVE
jgi:hypothetical protein